MSDCQHMQHMHESEIQLNAYEKTQILSTKAKYSSETYEQTQILLTKADCSLTKSV